MNSLEKQIAQEYEDDRRARREARLARRNALTKSVTEPKRRRRPVKVKAIRADEIDFTFE